MSSNLETILNNLSPITGAAAIGFCVYCTIKKMVDHKLSGRQVLVDLLWFCPFIALMSRPIMVIKIGNMFIDIATNLLAMLGFGGLK